MNEWIKYLNETNLLLLIWIAVALLVLWRIAKWYFPVITIREGQKGLVYFRGKLTGIKGPGRYHMICGIRDFQIVDVRKTQLAISGQEVLTLDQVSLKISVIVVYQIIDPAKAIVEVDSYINHLYTQAQQALRQVVSRYGIEELVEKRVEMGPQLLALVAPLAETIGIEVSAVEVKDIMLPGDLRNAFAQAVRARKEGQAALEKVRAETAALRNLANAAKLVEDLPGLAKLRVLQTMEEIAKGHGNTFVMGVPDGYSASVGIKKGTIET